MDIITPILSIVSILCSCSTGNNRCCYLLDLQENKEDLNNALAELKATRADVKRRVDEVENNPNELMKRTHEVDNWLQCVQTVEGKVGEILEKCNQEIEGRCFGGNCPINCWSARKIGKLVLQKLPIVNDLKSKGDLFVDVAYRLPPPLVQREPVDLTVGMESMFDEVWRLLAEDEVRILGLYGYGGVGKTTLLKQINNEFLKTTTTTTSISSLHGFDVVILVVVSKVINIAAIQKEIGDRLELSSPNEKNIFNALSKKNFVLLLDDLWEGVDLQSIGIPPPPENKKSKVVFTTRSKTVCGHMDANIKFRVECLPWDKAWTLFQEKVGNETLNSHTDVLELAKVVAGECDGLPLALITIGRAMSTKKTVQEWNHAITTLRRAASEFPGEARNYGYDVIGDLKGACLLESTSKYGEHSVKMHDTIRDMALWITRECGSSKTDKLLTIDAFDCTSERLWYNAERICFMISSCRDETEVPTLQSPNLLTLINLTWSIDKFPVPQNFFEYMPNLRVLDLRRSGMETFPTSITGLLELRYLSLSWTRINELPEELGKLVNLKYLNLSNMKYLEKIPSGVIGSLLELRVLDIHGCPRVDWDLDEMYKLKHLNDLAITIKTQHNMNKLLSSNKNLQMCTRHLILQSETLRLLEANMRIEQQQQQQQHLDSCFQNLVEIEIWNCNAIKDLTWVGYVGNLKGLYVSDCKELEEIVIVDVDDFGRSTGGGDETILTTKMIRKVDIFKTLKNLRLMYLPKLKTICGNALAFPCLESMLVSSCPQLKKLPLESGSNVNNTLREILGGPKWWSELQWEEKEGDHNNNNNNNNNNNELLKSKFLPYLIEYSNYDCWSEYESFDDE